jgi:uncharacterized protein (DUF3084 family)
MSSFKEIRDFLGEMIAPQIKELVTTLKLIDQHVDGVRANIATVQTEMKELRHEQKAIAERLARLEGNFAGAAERIRLEVLNEFLKTQARQAGKKPPKSLPPKS